MGRPQDEIISIGKALFAKVDSSSDHIFQRAFWVRLLLSFLITKPRTKHALFSLVERYPSQTSSAELQKLMAELLKEPLSQELSPIVACLISPSLLTPWGFVSNLLFKLGTHQAAKTFIAGTSIYEARRKFFQLRSHQRGATIDLLGEYAYSSEDCDHYVQRYTEAMKHLAQLALSPVHPAEKYPLCLSIKLSALCPAAKLQDIAAAKQEMTKRLTILAKQAIQHSIQLYIDAEDNLTNEAIYGTFFDLVLSELGKKLICPGIVVQCNLTSAPERLRALADAAHLRNAPLAVRLVKGAYWEQEMMKARESNITPPVWNTKQETDACFEELAQWVLDRSTIIHPAFGTHNIRSIASIIGYANSIKLSKNDFELQTLYGMAQPISNALTESGYYVREYMPIGDLKSGIGYLVRRLIENSSNESFLKMLFMDEQEQDALLLPP